MKVAIGEIGRTGGRYVWRCYDCAEHGPCLTRTGAQVCWHDHRIRKHGR